jgi:hypothetical protein
MPVVRVEYQVTRAAGRSVEAVEVMLVVESRLINRAKGSAAVKATARTRAKMVERRILVALCEDQWSVCKLEKQKRVSGWILFGSGVGAM